MKKLLGLEFEHVRDAVTYHDEVKLVIKSTFTFEITIKPDNFV